MSEIVRKVLMAAIDVFRNCKTIAQQHGQHYTTASTRDNDQVMLAVVNSEIASKIGGPSSSRVCLPTCHVCTSSGKAHVFTT